MDRLLPVIAVALVAAWALWPAEPSGEAAPTPAVQPDPAPRAAYRPAPLPHLDGLDDLNAPPARPAPTASPALVTTDGRPAPTFRPRSTDDTAQPVDPATRAAPPSLAGLGSVRMAPDLEAHGITGEGFVPVGGDVAQDGVVEHVPTIDYADPVELAFKREAGDLTNPVGLEEQIKRDAHGDARAGDGGSDTAEVGAVSPSAAEFHAEGVLIDPTEAPNPSATERHVNGEGPVFDWRAAGLSPTEADAVPVEDLTNTVLANPPVAPADPRLTETLTPEPEAPVWAGEGTLTPDSAAPAAPSSTEQSNP